MLGGVCGVEKGGCFDVVEEEERRWRGREEGYLKWVVERREIYSDKGRWRGA